MSALWLSSSGGGGGKVSHELSSRFSGDASGEKDAWRLERWGYGWRGRTAEKRLSPTSLSHIHLRNFNCHLHLGLL